MKKSLLILQLVLLIQNGFAGQFNFAAPQFINFRIDVSRPFFTEDVNQDKIPDMVVSLYKGFRAPYYDSSVVPGIYLCIQDSMHALRPVYMFPEPNISGWEDINNDGKKDVVFAKRDSVVIYYRTDSTHFNRKAIFMNSSVNAYSIKIIDFNNNGLLDFVTFDYYQSNQTSPCYNQILIQPVIDSFVLAPIINNGIYGVTGKVITGNFNADNKTDLLIYFPDKNGITTNRAYLYTQTNNFQFSIRTIYLDNSFIKLTSFDKNKDGIDDIAGEFVVNKKHYLITFLKMPDSFMREVTLTSLDSSAFPSGDPYLLDAFDLNCDGSYEMIRSTAYYVGQQMIFDSRHDSLYKNPINMIFPGEDIRYIYYFQNFADYDLDGRKDAILTDPLGRLCWAKNNSYNDLSNHQYLYSTYDTVYAEIKEFFKTPIERILRIPTDTTIRQTQINGGKMINPSTGLLDEYKILVSFMEVNGNIYYYYLKNILKNDYKIISGMLCGKSIQDTIIETNLYTTINAYFDTFEHERFSSTLFKTDTIFLSTNSLFETSKTSIIIYPNPTADEFYIQGCTQSFPLELWNTIGQSFVLQPIQPGVYSTLQLPEGYYKAVVYDHDDRHTLPIIIQR